MGLKNNIWVHIIAATILMFCFFIVFFFSYYLGGVLTASTTSFICFTIFLLITFMGYRSNYRAVPSRKMIRKYKHDYEQLREDRKASGKTAILIILTYLPLNIVALTVSLLLTYN